MITPLLMLALLIGPWALFRGLPWLARGPEAERERRIESAGRAGLVLVFLFAASGHFLQTGLMAQMLPPWVPARVPLVWATGVLEVAIAIGLLMPAWRHLAAWTALVVLVAFFPANVYAAWHQVPMGGHAWGLVYLFVRLPLQLVLLAWTWRFGLGRDDPPRWALRHDKANKRVSV